MKQIWVLLKLNYCTADVSYFTKKSFLIVCVLETLSFHITVVQVDYWTIVGLQTVCDVTYHFHWPTSFKTWISSEQRETFHFQQINVKTFL